MQAGDLIASDSRHAAPSDAELDRAWQVLDEVMDPEVPVVSVTDLGIVREINWQEQQLRVVITPTYSGCPATEFIEQTISQALSEAGFGNPIMVQQLTPAWTTDWLNQRGRDRLEAYGIAPPVGSASKRTLLGEDPVVRCPHCKSEHTEQLSEFGSTACKALYRCIDCREPFDYFKCI